MFKKQKKLFTIFTLLALLLSSGSNVSRAATAQNTTPPISVQSVNTAQMSIGFNISASGTASISSDVIGKIGTTKIKMTITLQKYNSSSKSWTNVNSWEKTSNSTYAAFETSFKLGSKGTFRCKLTSNVWKDGKKETINLTSGTQTY